MAVIQNGDIIQLTGLDAFKYEYNTHQGIKGIIKGLIGLFIGRKVTLAEGRSLLKGHAPEASPPTELPERSVQELAPADETQLKKGTNPKDRSSSVPISQSAQLTVDSSTDNESNVLEGSSDSLKMRPKPLDKGILVALGLSLDFPDQGEKVIMDWLDSSDFMDKAARPETATLLKHITHRCVFEQNKVFFMDICGSLGSRSGSRFHIPLRHEDLYRAFVTNHKLLLSNDDQSSSEACRVIGMSLINELDSYLKEIEPPETQEKTDWHAPNVRWMDKHLKKIMAIDENQLIDIFHGGGRYYLKQFLSGQASGYPLKKSSDTGIQVYPHFNLVDGLDYVETRFDEASKRREIEKYSQTSLRYLDLPARLTGKIPAKHVIAAEYLFEGGITASSVSALVEPKITVLNRSLPPEASDHQEPET